MFEELIRESQRAAHALGAISRTAGDAADAAAESIENWKQNNSRLVAIYESGVQTFSAACTRWRDYNDQIVKDIRNLGISVREQSGYQREFMEMTKRVSEDFGIAMDAVMKFQEKLSEANGRAQLLNKDEQGWMASGYKLVGEQTTLANIKEFDRLGGSMQTATAHMAQAYGLAKRYGLNAQQTSEAFAKNLKLAESYTFSGGIQGITKMTLLSQKLKFDMQDVAKSAESNFSTIEGAIENSAKIQMLGGNYGAMFSNPMDVMYEALNDMEGFTQRIEESVGEKGKFNKATGTVEISAMDKQFLKEYAKSAGLDYDTVFNMATQSTKNKQIESELKGNFTEEQKAYITSNAKYDMDKQQHYIEKYNPETEQMDKIYTNDISADQIAELQNIAAPEEQIRGDVAVIKTALLDFFGTDAKTLVSQRERETGMKESITNAGAELVDTPMHGYGSILDSLHSGGLSPFWKFATDGAVGTAMLYGGKWGWNYLKRRGASQWMRNLFGRGGGAGGAGTPSMTGPSPTSTAFQEQLGNAEASGLRASSVTGAEGAAGTAASGGKFQNAMRKAGRGVGKAKAKVGGAVKKGLSKLKGKGGKVALAALAAGTIYSMFGGGSDESEGAEAPEGMPLDEGGGVQGGTEVLDELKKITSILEKIHGVNADQLLEEKEAKASQEENAGQGYLDGTAAGSAWNGAQTAYGAALTAQFGKWGLTKAASGLGSAGTYLEGKGLTTAGSALKSTGGAINRGVEAASSSVKKAGSKVAEKTGLKKVGTAVSSKLGKTAVAKTMTKVGTKALMKVGGTGGLGIAGAGVDILNGVGQAAGWWEEGSTTDKLMNIGSDALTGAAMGSMVGGPIGAAIGGAVGTIYGVVDQYGEEIKKGVKKAWGKVKNGIKKAGEFFTGEKDTKEDKEQLDFETTKLGKTDINDPEILQKAALATIGIHDLLISKWNVDNGKKASGKSKGLFGNIGSGVKKAVSAVGSAIGGIVSGIGGFIGGIFGGGSDESKSETDGENGGAAESTVDLKDPDLMPKAAGATIEIRDFLFKIFGKDKKKLDGRVPEMGSSSVMSNVTAAAMTSMPIGAGLFGVSKIFSGVFGDSDTNNRNDKFGTSDIGQEPIKLDVSGTIRLDLGGVSKDVDANKLLNNPVFLRELTSKISDSLRRNATMGAGSNNNNQAQLNTGHASYLPTGRV